MKRLKWIPRWLARLGVAAEVLHVVIWLAGGCLGAWLVGGILDLGLAGYVIGFVIGLLFVLGGVL